MQDNPDQVHHIVAVIKTALRAASHSRVIAALDTVEYLMQTCPFFYRYVAKDMFWNALWRLTRKPVFSARVLALIQDWAIALNVAFPDRNVDPAAQFWKDRYESCLQKNAPFPILPPNHDAMNSVCLTSSFARKRRSYSRATRSSKRHSPTSSNMHTSAAAAAAAATTTTKRPYYRWTGAVSSARRPGSASHFAHLGNVPVLRNCKFWRSQPPRAKSSPSLAHDAHDDGNRDSDDNAGSPLHDGEQGIFGCIFDYEDPDLARFSMPEADFVAAHMASHKSDPSSVVSRPFDWQGILKKHRSVHEKSSPAANFPLRVSSRLEEPMEDTSRMYAILRRFDKAMEAGAAAKLDATRVKPAPPPKQLKAKTQPAVTTHISVSSGSSIAAFAKSRARSRLSREPRLAVDSSTGGPLYMPKNSRTSSLSDILDPANQSKAVSTSAELAPPRIVSADFRRGQSCVGNRMSSHSPASNLQYVEPENHARKARSVSAIVAVNGGETEDALNVVDNKVSDADRHIYDEEQYIYSWREPSQHSAYSIGSVECN